MSFSLYPPGTREKVSPVPSKDLVFLDSFTPVYSTYIIKYFIYLLLIGYKFEA